MDVAQGYWAEDDETGEVGFLDEFEDVFWIHDDCKDTWIANRFRSRRMRKGNPKGKGKGKGSKGKSRFRGKKGGKANYGQDSWYEGSADWGFSKGKNKAKAKKEKPTSTKVSEQKERKPRDRKIPWAKEKKDGAEGRLSPILDMRLMSPK